MLALDGNREVGSAALYCEGDLGKSCIDIGKPLANIKDPVIPSISPAHSTKKPFERTDFGHKRIVAPHTAQTSTTKRQLIEDFSSCSNV